MGVDACAMLCLKGQRAQEARSKDGNGVLDWVADDAAIVYLGHNYLWAEARPQEALATFKEEYGALLSLHEDSRGLCFFPDTTEPQGTSYDELVDSLVGDFLWVKSAGKGRKKADELDEVSQAIPFPSRKAKIAAFKLWKAQHTKKGAAGSSPAKKAKRAKK